MNFLPLDILFLVFSYLLPRERIRYKIVSKNFYTIYLKHLLSRNNLDSNKYILYRRSNIPNAENLLYNITQPNSENSLYNITRTDDKYIFLRTKRSKKEIKVKKLFNKYGVVYFKFQNNFIYVYEKEHVKEIEKETCQKCKKFDFYNICGIFNRNCTIEDCKKVKYYNRKLKDIFDKDSKIDLNNFCEHIFCHHCTIKLSFLYNVKSKKYFQKLFIY